MDEAHDTDLTFQGSIPEGYQRHLVPLLFHPYAVDLADRVAALAPSRVLELAAGTGVLTRELADRLPAEVEITATDLSDAMLEIARGVGTSRPVTWQQADAMHLPFDDDAFDVVVCQFGVMFFPDRPAALAGIRRVLRPGGTFLFNSWDGLATNDFPRIVNEVVADMFPDNPSRFMERVPHGYHDHDRIRADIEAGGFDGAITVETVAKPSRAASPFDAVVGFCRGTPVRTEILDRGGDPEEVARRSAAVVEQRYGPGPVEARITAHVATATAT